VEAVKSNNIVNNTAEAVSDFMASFLKDKDGYDCP
jgi:hypothetical protein